MQILSGMPGHRHSSGFAGVMILSVAATRANKKPAVVFDLPDDFSDFHGRNCSHRFRHVFVLVFLDEHAEHFHPRGERMVLVFARFVHEAVKQFHALVMVIWN